MFLGGRLKFLLLFFVSVGFVWAELPPLDEYISGLAKTKRVSEALVFSILFEENQRFCPVVTNTSNRNGSVDYGLFQLNSNSLPDFLDFYWDRECEFDWKNPYHNAFVAVSHMADLSRSSTPNGFRFNYWLIALAYNAGYTRAVTSPPHSSLNYAERVVTRMQDRNFVSRVKASIRQVHGGQ